MTAPERRKNRKGMLTGFWWSGHTEKAFGRLRSQVEDNIIMVIRIACFEDIMWMELSQDRVRWRYLEIICRVEICISATYTFSVSTLYVLGNAKVN